MKYFRLTVIMFVVGAFFLLPVLGCDQSDDSIEWLDNGDKEFDEKNYEKAIEHYAKAISIDPDDAYAYYRRGGAYYHLKRYNKAIKDLTKVISIDPNKSSAYNDRGWVYYEMKKYDKALEDYE